MHLDSKGSRSCAPCLEGWRHFSAASVIGQQPNQNSDGEQNPKTTQEQNSGPSSSPSHDQPRTETSSESYGIDLYPERQGVPYKPSWWRMLFKGEGREAADRLQCEERLWKVVHKSPLIRLMLASLKSLGCEFDLTRHMTCEVCHESVMGGYDAKLNQVVVCQNVCHSEGMVQGALAHELVHMFDFCRNKLDYSNLDHLACTEVRAANLTGCSFLSSLTTVGLQTLKLNRMHRECVKERAFRSVLAVRKVSEKEAMAAIERVFEKCYEDLEPVGRRIRRNSFDMHKAYNERHIYGYED